MFSLFVTNFLRTSHFLHNFFLFCQIALLNFAFCCFLTLNYLDGFGRKCRKREKKRCSLSWKSSSVFILCDKFSLNITFSSQFFLFCHIALLNFDFCCFLTLNYLDGFGRKREKGLSLSCIKHSYSHLLCAIFFNFVTLHSFIQYFRNF